SVREYGAHWAYQQQVAVAKDILAVDRWRQLFSAALDYPLPNSAPDFGLNNKAWPDSQHRPVGPYLVAVTNASWSTKCLPVNTWRQLLALAAESQFKVLLPWGSEPERLQAEAIAEGRENAVVLPRLSLSELAGLLANSHGALCNDTGLAHIAAAVGVPTVTAYGPTDPALIAATGERSAQISASGFACAPCYRRQCHTAGYTGPEAQCLASIEAKLLWDRLCALMA
ncbi:MAG TPA: glycosyltransferase family 9 protein, partial [Cellvibrionaceae bacterium]